MAQRKSRYTKQGIQKRLERALESLNRRSTEYPNIPRSAYNLKQQEAYVKKHPESMSLNNMGRGVTRMINYADRRENKREQQLRETAARLMSNASNGG